MVADIVSETIPRYIEEVEIDATYADETVAVKQYTITGYGMPISMLRGS